MQSITNVDQVGEEKREMSGMDAPEVRSEGAAPLMGGAASLPDHGTIGAPIGSVDLFNGGLMPSMAQQGDIDESDASEVGAVPALGT